MNLFGSLKELVSIVFRKDGFQQTVRPNQTTTYSADRDIQLPQINAAEVLVGRASTDTLTNKSISGSTNTLTNISLTTAVTGVLPTANGGTGQNSTATFPTSGTILNDSNTVTVSNKTLDNTSTVTVKDTNLTIQDDGDTTKQAKFQASGISTATTRTYTLPDASDTLVVLAASQSLSNKTLGNSNSLTVLDTNLTVQDDGDTSKQAKFQASGITTATTRTFTFPDASDTLVVLAATQTLTNKTLSGNTASNFINGAGTLNHNSTGTITVPNATDTLVGKATTDTLTNKTLSGNTATNLVNSSGTFNFNSTGTITAPNATDTLVGKATTDILTNKTLSGNTATNLVNSSGTLNINSTGTITVPNATDTLVGKATTDALTNKDYQGGTASNTSRFTLPKDTTTNINALTRKQATLIYDSTLDQVKFDNGTTLTALATSTTNTDSSTDILNLSLAASESGGALTVALKDKGGSDPSGSSFVQIGFRNATAATGTYLVRSVTAALSVATPTSGATLGGLTSIDAYIYVYAIDNAGTVELALAGSEFDEGTRQSTTAISGSSTADNVLYSTSARTNVPVRLIGRLKSNQATPGTYSTAISEISLTPFDMDSSSAMASGLIRFSSGISEAAYVGSNPQVGGSSPFQVNSTNQRKMLISTGGTTIKLPSTNILAGEVVEIYSLDSAETTVQSSNGNLVATLRSEGTPVGCVKVMARVNAPTTVGNWTVIYRENNASISKTNATGNNTSNITANSLTFQVSRVGWLNTWQATVTFTLGAGSTSDKLTWASTIPTWALPVGGTTYQYGDPFDAGTGTPIIGLTIAGAFELHNVSSFNGNRTPITVGSYTFYFGGAYVGSYSTNF